MPDERRAALGARVRGLAEKREAEAAAVAAQARERQFRAGQHLEATLHREAADTSEQDALIDADAAAAEARRGVEVGRRAAARAVLQAQATAGQLSQIAERTSRRRQAHDDALAEREAQQRLDDQADAARRDALAAEAAAEDAFRGDLRAQMAEKRAAQERDAELLALGAATASAAREEYEAHVAVVAAEEPRPHEHHRRKVLWSF
ncbi:hypothetical protein WJX81_006904 [Elliptochloris bilobata]|uniref:Uncharacterized protein n=1 Tax=Elliptochloris bilobata TaxID=381761 RepID=A0AAW1SGK0_9CHLO